MKYSLIFIIVKKILFVSCEKISFLYSISVQESTTFGTDTDLKIMHISDEIQKFHILHVREKKSPFLKTNKMIILYTYLSTLMQHRCKIEAVEKYTSKEFHTSHIKYPNNHLPPVTSTLKLKHMAPMATNISANAKLTTK